jgi:AraC-like DNA-binding protein
MFFVDTAWLADLQQDFGLSTTASFQPVAITHTTDANAFRTLIELHATLTDPERDALQKHCDAINVFRTLPKILGLASEKHSGSNPRVERAAEYLDHNYWLPVSLDDICEAACLSASHLIRSFQQRYHMTPHAYLINRRVQHARQQLRKGRLIAEVAQECGFSDQAHLQRVFKKHLAVTPGKYRSACPLNGESAIPNNLSIAVP